MEIEVKKPVRFFFFFGLFLTLVLLGVRTCNKRRVLEEVVEVEKILNENKRDLSSDKESMGVKISKDKSFDVSNSDELKGFELDSNQKESKPKAPKKTNVKGTKNTAQLVKDIKKSREIAKQIKKPQVRNTKLNELYKKKVVREKQGDLTPPLKPNMKILVSGQGYALDEVSLAKLKGAIKLNFNLNKIKILLFSKDPQGRSLVVKKAELKSSLIRAGLKTSVDIDFEIIERSGYAEVHFY